MLQAAEGLPVNLGFYGNGTASTPEAIDAQIRAGACGLQIHGNRGATPAAIDGCLTVAERYDVQVCLHGDTPNGAGSADDTIRAIGGRTIHAVDSGGAGGGVAPGILTICGEANVLPGSSNPACLGTVSIPEAILHDIGALSTIASDSQAMGRVGELITRSFQTAHTMKVQREIGRAHV